MNIQSGIYQIVNTVNGKKYIGSSLDIPMRLSGHKCHLKKQVHHNKHLQNAWNKYGEENFIFNILIICDTENLCLYEQMFIDKLEPEYNIALYAECPSRGRIFSDESKLKMRTARLGKPFSEQAKIKLLETMNQPEIKEKMRLSHLGHKHTEEQKRKISIGLMGHKNTLGYKHTEKAKQKISNACKGNKHNLGRKHTEKSKRNMSVAVKKWWDERKQMTHLLKELN